ncbi:hypothetical protein [Fibrobacter sp. UWB16]|uniref:hypothetical protein n=1 Tax=Fibrobacter sp. UWB16 TaxID=1945874 RepID=UPI001F175733|nr:hypothetical protein [Fibrobacter sp. UWB16]
MNLELGDLLFSSQYFAEGIRYCVLRKLCKPLLYRWFIHKAGKRKSSRTFSFPECLQNGGKVVFFMPEEKEVAKIILDELPVESLKTILFIAHGDQEILFSQKKAQVSYYTDDGCRYGEDQFDRIEYQVKTYAPVACVYPGPHKPQFLYLALISGAACRIGFDCAREYPFLNMSLHELKTISPARMIARYFIKGKIG